MNQFKSLLLLAVGVLFAATSVAGDGNSVKVNVQESTLGWLGKKVTGEHNGHIKLASGTLEFAKGALTGGTFKIDMNTITNEDIADDTYKEKLVGHLKSDDFFGVEQHPYANLEITKVKSLGDGKYEVTGDLTIKGKTNPVTFEAEVKKAGANLEATANITVDRAKYDVKYGSGSFFDGLGDKMIYDEFELSVKLVADGSVL